MSSCCPDLKLEGWGVEPNTGQLVPGVAQVGPHEGFPRAKRQQLCKTGHSGRHRACWEAQGILGGTQHAGRHRAFWEGQGMLEEQGMLGGAQHAGRGLYPNHSQ
jgi:hypothetical protein